MPPWIYTVLGRRWFRGRKETAALISQNRRIVSDIGKHTKSSARQRFFSFAVVRQVANRLFLFMRIIIKSKCYTNVRGAFDFDRKTG